MNYRTLMLEFLADYREYHFDIVQLLLFDSNHEDNILKVCSDSNLIDIYQVKSSKVYKKKLSFNEISNSIVNLLFITEEPQALEIARCDNVLKNYQDLFSDKTIFDLNCKYLIIYPIYEAQQLLGAFFVFSNYQIIWKLEEKNVLNLLKNLEIINCIELIKEIETKIPTKLWVYKNKGFYLSNELSSLLNLKSYYEEFNPKGYSLKPYESISFLNGTVYPYEYIEKESIKSCLELFNLKLSNYTLVYVRSTDDESINELVTKVLRVIDEIDGSLGKYQLFQTSSNSLTILFNSEIHKKIINEYFKELSYIIVRSNIELTKKVDFQDLIDYLNISPIEEFKREFFDYYEQKVILLKKEQVLKGYDSSKIQLLPCIDSKTMGIEFYLIKDLYDLKHASKEIKLKSIKAIFKMANEIILEHKVIISLKITDLFNGEKPFIAYINVLKKICQENSGSCFICVDFDKKLFLDLLAVWPDFLNFVYLSDENSNILDIISMLQTVNGIYLASANYYNLLQDNCVNAVNFAEFLLKNTNKVLVKVTQNDIIKYHVKNVLLVCE